LFPEYDVLNAGSEDNKNNAGSGGGWALQSYFGRINYDYKGKYLFEANGRYDGSSRFAMDNRYSFFPSVSAGWRISEESFMESTKGFLYNLKIRASWGQLGNQNIGGSYYPYASYISLTNNYSIGNSVVSGARLLDMANAELTWETTEMWNIGIDFNLFEKLNITADYYSKKTTGILLQLDIPGIVGLSAPYQNAGIVTNKGWDIGASYHNNIGGLRYEVIANLSDVINNVVDIRGITKTSLTQSREGYPINSIYGHVALGYFKDAEDIANSPAQQFGTVAPGDLKYKNLNDDNVINAEDQEIIGSTIPRYNYSFNINLNYKNINFSMFWQGVGKADGYLNNAAIMPFFNGGTVQEQHKDRWTTENQNLNARFPRLTLGEPNNLRNSTWWLKDASYLRLKNMQIGYNFSFPYMKRMGIQNLKLYVAGENLLTFDKFWDGFDVEAPVGSGSYYPQLKTFSLGINVNF
jgi:TonB-linked SusC/RagA family outer membrane protein